MHRRNGTLVRWLSLGIVVASTLVAMTGVAMAEDSIDRILKAKQLKIGYIPSTPSAIKDPAT